MESAEGLTPGMCIDDVVLLIDIVIIYEPPESFGGFCFWHVLTESRMDSN